MLNNFFFNELKKSKKCETAVINFLMVKANLKDRDALV